MANALYVSELMYRYPGAERNAVDGVTMAFERGMCHVLIGANGSGKTTLLKMLTGVLKPTSGSIYVGEDKSYLNTMPVKERAKHIGMLLQESAVPGDMVLREFVLCGRYPYVAFWSQPSAEDRRIANEAITRCGLDELAEKPMRALSSGQRQLARIAQLVTQGAEILLLDEPTTFLDLSVQERIFGILKQLRRDLGVTVILSLHELHTAARIADEVYAMKSGRLVERGRPDLVLIKPLVREVFGVDEW